MPSSVALEQNLVFDFDIGEVAHKPLDEFHRQLTSYLEQFEPKYTIGVADCVHGGEWNSGLTHELLQEFPMRGVSSIIANEEVYEYNKKHGTRRRYMDTNLMYLMGRDAPPPDVTSGYELGRAPEVEAWISQFDLGLEPHGTEEEYGWAMFKEDPAEIVQTAARLTNVGFGVNYPTGLARLPNVLGLDMPSAWREQYKHAALLYLGFTAVGYGNVGPPLTVCTFVRDVMLDDLDENHLPPFIEGMKPVPEDVADALGIRHGCSTLAWNKDAYAREGGGVGEVVIIQELPEVRRCALDGARLCVSSKMFPNVAAGG